MALIACRECRKEVSDQAQACPNCGAPLAERQRISAPARKPSVLNQNIGCAPVALLAIIAFFVYSAWPRDRAELTQPRPAPTVVSSDIQRAAIQKFNGMPAIHHTEWLDGDFVIAASENGSSWQPVADAACAWIRGQGAAQGFSVIVLEASALRNKRWEQMARSRCN